VFELKVAFCPNCGDYALTDEELDILLEGIADKNVFDYDGIHILFENHCHKCHPGEDVKVHVFGLRRTAQPAC